MRLYLLHDRWTQQKELVTCRPAPIPALSDALAYVEISGGYPSFFLYFLPM
ncbi:hypothetical protein QY97_03796 [Bacillus thermotolerans]|nr:hypothetical protein QY97_03796 [Bacillus thermotolerans]